jgi:hypothetical protein
MYRSGTPARAQNLRKTSAKPPRTDGDRHPHKRRRWRRSCGAAAHSRTRAGKHGNGPGSSAASPRTSANFRELPRTAPGNRPKCRASRRAAQTPAACTRRACGRCGTDRTGPSGRPSTRPSGRPSDACRPVRRLALPFPGSPRFQGRKRAVPEARYRKRGTGSAAPASPIRRRASRLARCGVARCRRAPPSPARPPVEEWPHSAPAPASA